jgi:hypothetical protein
MRSIRPVVMVAMMAAAASCISSARAADKGAEQPFGGPPSPPNRNVEERPFGGPPPKQRSPRRQGEKCQTPQQTCQLEKHEQLGAKCTCPGDAAEGKVVQ